MNYRVSYNKHIFITIDGGGGFRVVLCSFGASVYQIKLNDHDFLITPSKKVFYNSRGYYGKTLGPIAGRYETIQYYPKEHNKIITHGDSNGLSFVDFDYKITQSSNKILVKFTYNLQKDEVFVGNNALYEVLYEIRENTNKLLISHVITAIHDTHASLSFHPYFLLSEKDVRNCFLHLPAKKVSTIGDQYRITGLVDIHKGFDFNECKLIFEELNGDVGDNVSTYGHYFSNVDFPITVSDKSYKITIDSDYGDALVTLDTFPAGVHFGGEKESRFRSIVIEPETIPTKKNLMRIVAGKCVTKNISLYFERISF